MAHSCREEMSSNGYVGRISCSSESTGRTVWKDVFDGWEGWTISDH